MLHKNFSAVILAAGYGDRMLSNIPKTMHKIGGKCMLQHLIDTVIKAGVYRVYIVHNNKFSMMIEIINRYVYQIPIYWILQEEILGTAHAVKQVLLNIDDDLEEVLVLYGDVPLISYKTLRALHLMKLKCDIVLLTAILTDPVGYGRIIRNKNGDIINIIENDDIVRDEDKNICEINTGIFISLIKNLRIWLEKLIIHNDKNEFYLTDIVNVAHSMGNIIHAMQPTDIFEIIGVNNKSDLVYLERIYQRNQAKYLLSMGVMISDPNRFDLRGTLVWGKDIYIDVNVIIQGHVILGDRVKIGANCILSNSVIKDDVTIYPFSIIENTIIHNNSKVGPFSRLRPGTELKEKSCVGNFVELKNTSVGDHSKINHFSCLGDTKIGARVNIGAGTIVCNYDGSKKHFTNIDDNVFVGSGSQLVAPLTIGKNAVIGAGTTVTQDVLENDTIISRIRQFSIASKKNL